MFSGVINNTDLAPKVIIPYANSPIIIIICSIFSLINVLNKMYSEAKSLLIKMEH